MVMSDAEIKHNFNQAQDKRAQVQILADLNGTTKKYMAEYLERLGLQVPTARGSKKVLSEFTATALVELLGSLCKQYPNAKIRAGNGDVNTVTVISRYRLDGTTEWTQIRLDATAKNNG